MKHATHATAPRARPAAQRKASLPRAHTRDKYERQADALAHRFVKGDHGLGRGIMPAPAAQFTLPASPGEALPLQIRSDLERAFDADLHEVRIHRDASADQAVRTLRAQAFAGGAHIYFGTSRFDPVSVPGRTLIAHEVAHVLQQTARVGAAHAWEAVPLTGSGTVQCQLDELVHVYREHVTGTDASFDAAVGRTHAADPEGRLAATTPPADSATAFANDIVGGHRDRDSILARSLLCDVAKALDLHDAALHLIDSDTNFEFRTAFEKSAFFAFLRRRPGAMDWAARAFYAKPELQRFWPTTFVAEFRSYFFQPHQSASTNAAIQLAFDDKQAEWRRPGLSSDGDRVRNAWRLLQNLDRERVRLCNDTERRQRALFPQASPTALRARVAQALKEHFDAVVANSAEAPFTRDLAGQVARVADHAAQVLTSALSAVEAEFGQLTGEGDIELFDPYAEHPERRVDHALAAELHTLMLEQLAAVMPEAETANPPDRPDQPAHPFPSSEQYAERLRRYVEALTRPVSGRRGTREALTVRIGHALAQAARPARPDMTVVEGLAFLMALVEQLVRLLQSYSPARDDLTPHFEDERRMHAVRLARAHAQIAVLLGWTDLVQAARPYVLTARPHLYIGGEWQPDEAPPARMVSDFAGQLAQPVIEGTPLTVRHLARWFRLDRRTRERGALLVLLANESRPTAETVIPWRQEIAAVTNDPELIRAQLRTGEQRFVDEAAHFHPSPFALRDPQRFVVHDFEMSGTPTGDAGWSEIIRAHPKTEGSLIAQMPSHGAWIFPTNPRGELFGWITPGLDPLIEFLAASSVFTARLGGRTVDTSSFDWLTTVATGDVLTGLIDEAIEQELRPLDVEVPLLWRRLTTYRRRVLALRAAEKLQSVIDDRPRAVDPRYLWPDEVAAAFVDFEGSVRPTAEPNNDVDIQMALLTIQLAPQLALLFTETHPYEGVARRIYQYVLLGLRVLRDPTLRDRVQAITHADEALHALYDNGALTATAIRQLDTARNAMEATARRVRASRGFHVAENRQALVPEGRATSIHVGRANAWVRDVRFLPNGEVDPESGDRYFIREIYETFSYFPPYGSPTPASMRPGAGGVYAPPLLTVNGETLDLESPEGRASANERTLMLLSINDQDVPVTAGNIDLLNTINDMVLGRSVQISMERLAVITQAAMEAIIAGVEVAFPEAAYAETVANVAQFTLSDEFREIVRQLREDPHALLERVLEYVRGRYLTADAIWRFLLLGGQHPLFRLGSVRPARARRRTGATGRLGRMLRALANLGRRINRAIERLREYTRPPLRAVQGNLMQRPRLVWVLRRALMLAELAADLLPSDLEFHPEDIADIPNDLSSNLQQLVEGLSRLELPERVFEMGPVISLIASFVLSRMGLRGRVIEFILSHAPVPVLKNDNTTEMRVLMDDISDLIAEGLNRTPVDPNNLWLELLPLIRTRFDTARDDLVDGIVTHVNAFFVRINPLLPATTRFRPVTRPSGLPSMELVPTPIDDQADLHRTPPLSGARHTPRLSRAAGLALAPGARDYFEPRFGRDLSHVRVHGGSAGRAATAPLAADALTSGSHVYVRPDLDLDSLKGRRILAHELAHVVQQTQPHQPGLPMAPRRGTPGLGVRTSRALEGAAERSADALAAGRRVNPGDLRQSSEGGLQPAVSAEVLDNIVRELSKTTGAADFEMRPVAGAARVPGVSTARQIWQHALAVIRETRADGDFARFMRNPPEVRALAVEQITRDPQIHIDPHIAGIAQLAQRPLPGPRPESGPETELNPGRFVTLLESFIFARRGIAVQISLGEGTVITRVRFTNVHLAWVGGTHRLWDIAFERTYPTTPPAERAALQREVRQLLNVLGPQPFIWAAGEFKLSDSFKRRLQEEREARARGAESVPPKREYLQTGSTRADGLAISTHGDLRRRGIGAFGRESHHTTQYLLAEFFGDSSHGRQMAFPRGLRSVLPRGVSFNRSGDVDYISSGSSTLDVRQLDPDSGRGNNMPAILLSATAHRHGDLHVLPETDWRIGPNGSNEEHGTRTQGFAIRNQFNNALDTVGLAMRNDSQETRSRIGNAVRADSARVEREIYSAAVATYHWMHRRMISRLREGLKNEERAYYRGIAARNPDNLVASAQSGELKPAFDLIEGDMETVWSAAKQNNDRVMSAAGWPNPS